MRAVFAFVAWLVVTVVVIWLAAPLWVGAPFIVGVLIGIGAGLVGGVAFWTVLIFGGES